jgi:hypothetical protein
VTSLLEKLALGVAVPHDGGITAVVDTRKPPPTRDRQVSRRTGPGPL